MSADSSLPNRFSRFPSAALATLALAYFAMATGGIAMVGAVPAIAHGLHVDLPVVAGMIAVYSITFAIAAPLIQVLFGHWPRKRLLLAGLALLSVGTGLSALMDSAHALLAARVLTGLGAAAIGPVASALGAGLVKPAGQGRALATVFSGMTVASVASVPAASVMADALGWRSVFGGGALVAVLAWGLVAAIVPNHGAGQRLRFADLGAVLRDRALASGVAVNAFALAGMSVLYTFISPLLSQRFGATPAAVSSGLLVLGAAGVAGNLLARRVAGVWSAERALAVSLVALIVVYALLGGGPARMPVALGLIVVWAVAADIYMPSQQRRLVEMAPTMRGLVLALNSSAIYLGMSGGSSSAGQAYVWGGVAVLPGVAAGFMVAALATLWYSRRARRNAPGACPQAA